MKKRVQKITAFVMALAIMFVTLSTLSPPITAEAATEFNEIVCVSGTTVNVRSGPGTSYSRVGLAAKYSMYEYISSSGNWHQIQFGSQKAWISASYAKRSYEVNGYNVQITGCPVNIRSGPGTNFTRVGRLTTAGNVYLCYAKMTSVDGCLWYNIDFGGTNAWVLGSLAKLVAAPTTTAPTTTTTAATTTTTTAPTTTTATEQTTTTTAATSVPSSTTETSASDVPTTTQTTTSATEAPATDTSATTATTTVVTTTSTTTSTSETTTTSTTTAPTTAPTTPAVTTKTVIKVTGSSVNVRSGAGVSYSKIGLAYAGNTYTYLGEAMNGETTWYKIQFTSSTVGWISGTYSDKITTTTSDTPVEDEDSDVAEDTITIVTITGDYVNVRNGAGTSNSKIGSTSAGTTYTYLGEGKDSSGTTWYKIQFTSSTVGWVTSQYSTKSTVSTSDSAVQSYINKIAGTYGADGIQVAIIDNGKVTDTFNYGWATKNSDKMTSDNIIRVASISKVAVAINAMKMQEQGIVNLNTNIGSYWGASLPKAVTLKSLLSHTSTLYSLSYNSTKSGTLSQLKSSGSYRSGTVGSSGMWAYNNYAVGIAGSTLEVASGKTLNNYAKENIFGPLGMDASFSSGLVENTSALATLYYADGSVARSAATSKGITGSSTPGNNTSAFAGGLTGSAEDIAKMFAMLANDGTYDGVQVLTPASVATIETKLFSKTENGGTFYQCLPLRYKANLYGESELYYHTGNAYGVLALASYNPATGDGVVVVTTGASATRDSQGVYAVCSSITEYVYKYVI